MRCVINTLALCLILSAFSPAVTAQQPDQNTRVRFARGTTARTYRGSISHSTNTYVVRARRGQTMTVSITSPQKLALFHVTTQEFIDGEYGDAINLATEARRWSLKLPTTADYYVAVVAERSVSDYTITIAVK